jgi:hypothetical protein
VSSASQTTQQGTDTGDQAKGLLDKAKSAKGGKDGEDSQGEDDDRLKAKDDKINTPINDKVHGKKDKQDWRKFVLSGQPGILTVELHWDEEKANLDVDVFDEFGTLVGKSPPRLEGQQVKKVLVQVDNPSLYYVRVSAPGKNDTSIYTLAVRWKGSQVMAARESPASQPTPNASGTPAGPAQPGTSTPAVDPNKLFGSVVSAYREGAGWVIYLDKGSADRLRSGMTGTLLDGSDGEKPLEGGNFTVSQVLGDHKAVARTTLSKAIGKNKRILVVLK